MSNLYWFYLVVAVYGNLVFSISPQNPPNDNPVITVHTEKTPLKNESHTVSDITTAVVPVNTHTNTPRVTVAPSTSAASLAAVTTTTTTSTTLSEVTDMRNTSYQGGTDVDEMGSGIKIEHRVREDNFKHPQSQTNSTDSATSRITAAEKGMGPATATAIVISVCIGMVLMGYAVMILWRFSRIKKQSQRELLVNEEDTDITDEDLRHFEAACIQLEPEV